MINRVQRVFWFFNSNLNFGLNLLNHLPETANVHPHRATANLGVEGAKSNPEFVLGDLQPFCTLQSAPTTALQVQLHWINLIGEGCNQLLMAGGESKVPPIQ